ncbi:hypothetical protein HPG69_014137 [Diceros bicornis minor]|uniref:NADP-dependent oxidoreductase domain-containing protein n=1 Tax=Diceros bicornis minor TaxID=77932 RepID=A0A7J7FIW2_DICBM|nr:hypothetical protein HPG69_014137 [Diceros bicornis minor]
MANGTVERVRILYHQCAVGRMTKGHSQIRYVTVALDSFPSTRIALKRSLKKLGLDYLDLFIIHVPIVMKFLKHSMSNETGKLHERYTTRFPPPQALEKCKHAGLTKPIRMECRPYLSQSNLLEFCKCKDIVVVAYGALGSQRDPNWVEMDSPYLLEIPILNAVARKHNRKPDQANFHY